MIERYRMIKATARTLCDEHAEERAGQISHSLGESNRECADCQEIAARPERRLLQLAIEAVERLIDDEPEALGGRFIDPGCNECTEGLTPLSHDRGPCWRHAAEKLLKGNDPNFIKRYNARRKIELHAAVIASVMALADEEAGERVAFIDAAALAAQLNTRLDALVDANLI